MIGWGGLEGEVGGEGLVGEGAVEGGLRERISTG